jgi:hypothetical protein
LKLGVKAFGYSYNLNYNQHAQLARFQLYAWNKKIHAKE